ncbi:hypothetical protein ACO0LB_06215 [Undibacterium sp. SXout7W]|uniref:hypothetical protein n=1 Tax=Undibacterium sp. SXout7W TaxID=3413049 RepID=UPI003BF3D47E
MSERDLKLQVIFNMIERVTAPLKHIMGQSNASGKALKVLRDRLKDLDAQQKNVSGFRQLHTGLRETGERLDAARHKVKELSGQIAVTAHPTRTLTREFDRAVKAARLIKEQHQRESQQLQVLRDKLHAAGISTTNLSGHERQLRHRISETNSQIDAQKNKLSELAKRHEQVSAARQRMEKTRTAASNAKATGFDMAMTGAAIGVPVIKSLGESKHFETEIQRIHALGLGEKTAADAIQYSQAMKTYGTSSLENLELMRDSLTVFADLHHAQMVLPTLAKMKFANAAMYGEEAGAEKGQTFMNMLKVIELRGGLASKEKFEHEANLVQKVLTATGGRVGPNEWLNFIKTGGVAAKSLKDDAFFYKMEPLIQEMGGHRVGTGLMSAYSNLYQGKTTVRAAQEMGRLDLLDLNKVEYNKIGMIKQIKPGALAGGELMKTDPMAWLETVLLPKLAAKGITDQEQIKDTIATIMTNRTASNLFTQMYMQREQIHKNERLNAGAADIDILNKGAMSTTAGRELQALARINSAKKEIGEHILPIYASALEKVADVLESVTGWMKEHATATKVITISLTGLAAVLAVLGSLAIAVASVLGPFSILRYVMSLLGMRAAGTATRVGMLSRAWQWLVAVISRAGTMLASVGTWFRSMNILSKLAPLARVGGSALLWLGRAALMLSRVFVFTPWGAIIAAIGTAAYLIHDNWSKLSPFFARLWASIKETFNQSMMWFSSLKSRLGDIGMNLMEGLVNGIIAGANMVEKTINTVADNVIGWFKEKLGIHSPSVVFTELGQFTMEGLANGVANNQQQPLDRITSLTERMTQIAGGIALATTLPAFGMSPLPSANHLTPIQFDRRPPVAAAGNQTMAQAPQSSPIQIIINPTPGMDPQAIANAVAAELDRRERQKTQQKRSAMHDYDEY